MEEKIIAQRTGKKKQNTQLVTTFLGCANTNGVTSENFQEKKKLTFIYPCLFFFSLLLHSFINHSINVFN